MSLHKYLALLILFYLVEMKWKDTGAIILFVNLKFLGKSLCLAAIRINEMKWFLEKMIWLGMRIDLTYVMFVSNIYCTS
jgi:hypothetical protein